MRRWHLLVVGLSLAVTNRVAFGQPAAKIGLPIPVATLGVPQPQDAPASFAPKFRGAAPDPLVGDYSPAARLGPISDVRFGPNDDAPSSPQERFEWGLPDRTPPRTTKAPTSYNQSYFGEKFGEMFDKKSGHNWFNFESDHCFDDFISPVSNPFLAEDPRTLTELRPIFFYQSIPHGNTIYRGGNIEFFGLQGRLAITDRFSIVLNKFGGVAINAGSGSTEGSATGFAEVWLGPKYTWYRDDQTGTIAASGAIFQIPAGSSRIGEGSGGFSVAPWVSVAQSFGKGSYGTFHFMDTFGVSIAEGHERSSYVYNSLHLDYQVLNWNVYPLIEMNWRHYTGNGSGNGTISFQGLDAVSSPGVSASHDFLDLAIGARYKFTESIQVGIAAQFPLERNRDKSLNNFRIGIDMIWRY